MAKSRIVIADLRGGRNGTDPPLSLGDTQAVELLNVDHYDGLLGRKRGGSDNVAITGGTAFGSGIQSMFRHVPGADETAAELWAIDGAALTKRLTGGTSWADVTVDDAITAQFQHVNAVSFNGKLFLAYKSAVDRLHVYDPGLAAPRVRRVGIAPGGSAPTVADQGAGAYAAVLRKYRVRWLQFTGSVVTRWSEPTPSVTFTPDGAHGSARVTRPTAPGEGETHWEIEIQVAGNNWQRLFLTTTAECIAIATTTYDDSVDTTLLGGNAISDLAGTNTVPQSAKFLLTDGNRLLLAGGYESGTKNSRVWYTPVLGSTDHADDERIPVTTTQSNYIDLNENDGGFITGFGGPLNGIPYVFKYRDFWRLLPTGDVTAPYLPRRMGSGVGSINQKLVVTAVTETGEQALYFYDHLGPFRTSPSRGLAYLGRDCEDIWSTVNLGATGVVGWALYHADKHQVWFHVATGASNDPDTRMVFDTVLGRFTEADRKRGGWYRHTGNAPAARCGCLFANTLGASMSRDLKPYVGRASGTVILKTDTSTTDDAGTAFQAYVKTKPLAVTTLGLNGAIGHASLLAKASAATITQTIDRDFGLETVTATVSLAAAASETRVLRKIEGCELSQVGTVQIQLGDGSAIAQAWTLDALSVPATTQDPR